MHMPPFALILTAAGSSLRFSSAFAEGEGVKKEFLKIDGHTVLYRAAEPFFELPGLSAVVVTCREGAEDETLVAMEDLVDVGSVPMLFIRGGATRQESVHLALERLAALDLPFEYVAVHDGARPFVTPDLIVRTLAMAYTTRSGAMPALAVTDSVRRIDAAGRIVELPRREGLVRVQTPQVFDFSKLLDAHRKAQGDDATDDGEIFVSAGYECFVIEGDEANRKITYESDIPDARAQVMEYVIARDRGREDRAHDEMFRSFVHQGGGQ